MPLGQAAPVTEIADGVRYILSATSMTGQLIALDGGQHLGWDFPIQRLPGTGIESEHDVSQSCLTPSPATASPKARRILINDLVLDCSIGVHRHERDGTQRIRINLDLTVLESPNPIEDRLSNVLCYEDLIVKVRELATAGHVNLVETLAERLADLCLGEPGVQSVKVRVEKLDVFADAASVGVEISRTTGSHH